MIIIKICTHLVKIGNILVVVLMKLFLKLTMPFQQHNYIIFELFYQEQDFTVMNLVYMATELSHLCLPLQAVTKHLKEFKLKG